MTDPPPDRTILKWCPECGAYAPKLGNKHTRRGGTLAVGNRYEWCTGDPVEIMYTPVDKVRQIIIDESAKRAGTGHPGDILISVAMNQAIGVIDKEYNK